MGEFEKLVAFISNSLERELKRLKINELDKLDIRASIYEILEESNSAEEAHIKLLEYLEEERSLSRLMQILESYKED